MRLIEIHEQEWFANELRNDVTETLEFIFSFAGVYRNCVVRLQRALQSCKTRQVVDLCSGGGGPWSWLPRTFQDDHEHPIEVCLTDKYPNRAAFLRIRRLSHNLVNYSLERVDAITVPSHLAGFRTMFTSFHHFPEGEGVSILQQAVDSRQGIGIFEAARCCPTAIVLTPLMFLGAFAAVPFVRPFRASRLFWTYVIPVIPFVLFWDGLVSCLRAYSPKELSQMTACLRDNDYIWEVGEETGGLATVTYLIGCPVE